MVMDLLESSLKDGPLEQLACGGAPASDSMPRDVQKRFKNVIPYVDAQYARIYFNDPKL